MNKQLELAGIPRRRVSINPPEEEVTDWCTEMPPPHSGYWDVRYAIYPEETRWWFDRSANLWHLPNGECWSSTIFIAWRGLVTPPSVYPYRLDQAHVPAHRVKLLENLPC